VGDSCLSKTQAWMDKRRLIRDKSRGEWDEPSPSMTRRKELFSKPFYVAECTRFTHYRRPQQQRRVGKIFGPFQDATGKGGGDGSGLSDRSYARA